MAQTTVDNFVQEQIEYKYDDRIPDEFFVPEVKLGKEIKINFDCCFNDSVEIFINDKLVAKELLITDDALSFTGFELKVKFERVKKKNILKVVLTEKKVFCSIDLNKNYKVLDVNRIEREGSAKWWIVFQNYEALYE